MHGILFWLIVGLIAGGLAKLVVPGDEGGGWIGSIIVGLIGAFIGGFIFQQFFHKQETSFLGDILVSFVGAVVLLVIYHALTRNRGTLT